MMKNKILILIIVLLLAGLIIFVLQILPKEEVKEEEPIEKEIIEESLIDFSKIIQELDNSEKLVQFMNENFNLIERKTNTAYNPEEFYKKQQGGDQDFAVFVVSVLKHHKYETVVLRYKFEENEEIRINSVAVFREDVPKYIYFDQEAVLDIHGWSFRELLEKEEQRLNINIIEFTTLGPNILELTNQEWTEK